MPGIIAPASARAQAGRTLSDFQKDVMRWRVRSLEVTDCDPTDSPVYVKVKVTQATDTAHSVPDMRRGGRLLRCAWQEWVRSGHALDSGKKGGNTA